MNVYLYMCACVRIQSAVFSLVGHFHHLYRVIGSGL